MRETGPVNLRLSSLRGEGGDYEAEIRCQAIARTILGGLKNRLRLGGITVGAVRQVLADGTEIVVSTILGMGGAADIDSVYINKAVPVPVIEFNPEEEKQTLPQETRLIGIYRGAAGFDFGQTKFFSVDSGGAIIAETVFSAGALSSTYDFIAANPNTICVAARSANRLTRFFDRDWNLLNSVSLSSSGNGLVSIDGQYYLASNTGGVYSVSTLSEAGDVSNQFSTEYVIRSFTKDDDGFVWTVENNTALGAYVARQYDLNGVMLFQAVLQVATPFLQSFAVSDDSIYVGGTFGSFGTRMVIFRHSKTTGQLISELDVGATFTSTFSPGPLAWFDDKLWMGTLRANLAALTLEVPTIREYPADLSSETMHSMPLEAGDNQADLMSLSVDLYAALPLGEQELNAINAGA